VALLVPASAAVTRLAACVVILVSGARFAATGIYQLTADTTWRTVAGWIGLGLVVIGGYAATAFGLSGSFRTDVLPIGRRDVPTAPRP
jgi:succinate-acetate transporter protein